MLTQPFQSDEQGVLPYLHRLVLRIAPSRIAYLKFILEGYDGLGIISTLDSTKGIVEIRYPNEVQPDIIQLLTAVASTLSPASTSCQT
ncbi:DUF4911 domain-containing protein [Thermodesulfobacteriota bacterium]